MQPPDAGEYSGKLTPLAIRRLTRERDLLCRDSLDAHGIYVHFDNTESHKAVALIVGPEDTPYAGGPYLFHFTFPNSYPLRPPQVKFMTSDNRVRFNPNLYVNGKVCLSILGTWQGPSWTSACTFRTTLLSIQSLLNSQPLQNEPGYENDTGRQSKLYSNLVRYENVAVAALQLAKPLNKCLVPLQETIARVFLKHFDTYEKTLRDFDAREGTSDKCPVYSFVTRYAPRDVSGRLQELRTQLLRQYPGLSDTCEAASASSAAAPAATPAEAQHSPARPREEDAGPPPAKRARWRAGTISGQGLVGV